MDVECYTNIKWHGNIITFYREYDGEPIKHGKQISEFLKDYRILRHNAFLHHYPKKAYGIYMLTGQIVKFFREEVRDFVIHSKDEFEVDYQYDIRRFKNKPHIIIRKGDRMIFSGRPDQFLKLTDDKILNLEKSPVIYEHKDSKKRKKQTDFNRIS